MARDSKRAEIHRLTIAPQLRLVQRLLHKRPLRMAGNGVLPGLSSRPARGAQEAARREGDRGDNARQPRGPALPPHALVHPPRHQSGQHLAHRRRHGQVGRLRLGIVRLARQLVRRHALLDVP